LKLWRDKIAARPAVARAKERVFGEFGDISAKTMQSASEEDLDRFFGRSDKVPAQDFTAVKNLR
jgi:hypothetical protein